MDQPMDHNEEREVDKILKSVSKNDPTIRRKPKKLSIANRKKLSEAIVGRLSEYCDCYMLFGFDVNGNEMIIINSANGLEHRALGDLVMDFVNQSMLNSQDADDDEYLE